MIVERYASSGSVALPARRGGALRAHLGAAPAIAGRERLRLSLRRSVLAQLMAAMLLIVIALLIYLNQASKVSVLQFDIVDLQHEQIQLRMQSADLYASATSLQSLQRIESAATTQLHMSHPAINNVVWVSPVIPRVAPVPVDGVDGPAVQRSEPLAWMQHAISFLGSQL